MQTYPNQKTITIHKGDTNKGRYTAYTQLSQQIAMNEIDTLSGLKMWLYLVKNQSAYTLALSPTDCREWGITEKSYHSGVAKLIELGYLEARNGNTYDFYDLPPRERAMLNLPKRDTVSYP